MPKYTIEYSDSIEVEANSEEEAITQANEFMFCDGPKDYLFWCSSVEGEDDEVENAEV